MPTAAPICGAFTDPCPVAGGPYVDLSSLLVSEILLVLSLLALAGVVLGAIAIFDAFYWAVLHPEGQAVIKEHVRAIEHQLQITDQLHSADRQVRRLLRDRRR